MHIPFKAHENQLKIREALKFPYFIIICSYVVSFDENERCVCAVARCTNKQPNILHRYTEQLLSHFFFRLSLFFPYFYSSSSSSSFAHFRFLLHVNKQANNATAIEYTNYFCWCFSPCIFAIVGILKDRHIHYSLPFFSYFIRFVFVSFSIFTYF